MVNEEIKNGIPAERIVIGRSEPFFSFSHYLWRINVALCANCLVVVVCKAFFNIVTAGYFPQQAQCFCVASFEIGFPSGCCWD